MAIYHSLSPKVSATRLLCRKNTVALLFLHTFGLEVNGVATILLISNKQGIPDELHVADKHSLDIFFSAPPVNPVMEDLDSP